MYALLHPRDIGSANGALRLIVQRTTAGAPSPEVVFATVPFKRRVYNTAEAKEHVCGSWSTIYKAWSVGMKDVREMGDIDDACAAVDDAELYDTDDADDDDDDDAEPVTFDVLGEQPMVPRFSMVYWRAETGGGKSHAIREIVRRKNSLAGQGCKFPAVVSFAVDSEVFYLSFNSLCVVTSTDHDLVKAGGTLLPMLLRLLYIETADFSRQSWPDFVSKALEEFKAGHLDQDIVRKEVQVMLINRRGNPDAPLIVAVDELVLCKDLPGSFGGSYATAADAYRSGLCRLLDVCRGVMATTTVDETFVVEERKSSPRNLLAGPALRPLPAKLSRLIIKEAMHVMYKNGYTFNTEGLVVSSTSDTGVQLRDPRWHLISRTLAAVTGNHPRLVNMLASFLETPNLSRRTTAKSLLSDAASSLYQQQKVHPDLGRSKGFTEAILCDLLLGTGHDFFENVTSRHLTRGGRVTERVVPRAKKRGRGGERDGENGYTYDDISSTTVVSLVAPSEPNEAGQPLINIPPAALFALLRKKPSVQPTLPTLQWLVWDMLQGQPGLVFDTYEAVHIKYERALSLARQLYAEDFRYVTIKELYQRGVKTCFVGAGQVINEVKVDASIYREIVAQGMKLEDVLRLAEDPARRRQVLHSIFVLRDGSTGVDAIMFYECVEDCGMYKKGQLIAIAMQFKYSADMSQSSFSSTTIDKAWSKTEQAFGHLWGSWGSRVVFFVVARRRGSAGPPAAEPAAAEPAAAEPAAAEPTAAEPAAVLPEDTGEDSAAADAARRLHRGGPTTVAAGATVPSWEHQAMIFGRRDITDLYGPVFGGLIRAADVWIKGDAFQDFERVFIKDR